MTPFLRGQAGMTLIEILLALSIGTVVMAALLIAAQGIMRSVQLQHAMSDLQQAARHAERRLRDSFEAAGYVPSPWSEAPRPALLSGEDHSPPQSDRIHLGRWSRRNCFGHDNPTRDAEGAPAWYRLEEAYAVRADGRLVVTCWFGPASGPATRQLNAATLLNQVETLQLVLGEDQDGDARVDRWVPAGAWQDESRILGVRFAVMLKSEGAFGTPQAPELHLASTRFLPPDDGRLRLAIAGTVSLRGRIP